MTKALTITCPEPGRLQALLDSALSDADRLVVESHLGDCECCQGTLETLAVGDPSWSATLRGIGRDTPPTESAFWPAMRRLRGDGDDDDVARTRVDPVADERAGPDTTEVPLLSAPARPPSLAFLAPTTHPGSLGRLDHFEVLGEIGRGGMGIVLRGLDSCLTREVALKVLNPSLAENELAQHRFCREARAAASITHEHVVGVYQVDEDEHSGLPYLVMPLIQGESLEERLRRRGRLDVEETVRIGMQVAAGLAAAHAQGLVHRDIKPGNILLERGSDRVKLTDFGLARVVEDAKLTRSGFVAGTPLYMSPEQARGEDLDARSDLFSLGAVLYETCAGRAPFEGKTPLVVLRRLSDEPHTPLRELAPDIPDWLAALIDRLLSKDPDRRYPSAAELAEELAGRYSMLHPVSPLQVAIVPQAPAAPPEANGNGATTTTAAPPAPVGAATAPPLVAAAPPSSRRMLLIGAALGLAVGILAPLAFLLPGALRGGDGVAAGPAPLAILNANAGPIWSVAFSPDGRSLAMALDDGTVKLWDVATRSVRGTINAHHTPVWSLAFHPTKGWLATASDDGTVKLWDLGTGEEIRALKHAISVRAVAFAPDGRTLVSGSRDGKVRIWDPETGAERDTTGEHSGIVVGLAVASDSRTAASASGDKTIRLWDLQTGRELNTLQGHRGGAYSVAISPDRTIAASGGWDKVVRLWDLASGSPLAELSGHTQDIWSVAFSPDGRRIASVGEDHAAKLWDVARRAELATFDGHTGSLYTAAFSPDGTILATGGRDGTVRLWDVTIPQR